MSIHAFNRPGGPSRIGGISGWRGPRASCRKCGKHAEVDWSYGRGTIPLCTGCYRLHRSRFDGQPVANYSPFRPLQCRSLAQA